MTDPTREALDAFLRATNALRSAEAAARGFVSGNRIYNLRAAKRRHAAALAAIGDWIESQARAALASTTRKD